MVREGAPLRRRRYAAAHPVRADALDVPPDVLAGLDDVHPCVLDAYVNVFLTDAQQARFRDGLAELGSRRDLDWVSLDPLVPMGDASRAGGLGTDLPAGLVALGHPGGAWLEWLA